MEQKTCSKCGGNFPIEHFSFEKKSKNIRKTYCRQCHAERMRADRLKNGEKRRQWDRGRYRANPLRRYVTKAMRKYGLSVEQAELFARHPHCDICGRDNGGKRFALDHCHTTGKLRGLLCDQCNMALGKFRDDPHTLAVARRYVMRGGFGGYEPLTDEEIAALT